MNAPITFAAEPEDAISGNITTGGVSSSCSFTELKDSIYGTESAGSGGYEAIGPLTKYGYPLGKYQFIADTQNRISSQFPACNAGACANKNPTCGGSRSNCSSQPLLQAGCHSKQECLMDGLLQVNLDTIKAKESCQKLLEDGGRQITGIRRGQSTSSCRVTESGLLAAFHLGGTDECDDILRNGRGDCDNLGTCTSAYVCEHGGKPVPGSCSPSDFGYTGDVTADTAVPTLTAAQLEVVTGQGDVVVFGFDSLKDVWVKSLQMMTKQIVATMMQQVQIIGQFFDAKHQLETQRLMQQKTFEAHNRYHPSEQLCEVGTFAKNLAQSERRAVITQAALAKSMIDRALKVGDAASSEIGYDEDTIENSYLSSFCSPMDNAGQNSTLCSNTINPDRVNADIRFDKTIFDQLSLDIDLLDTTSTDDEETVFAMMDQLFMHNSFPYVSAAKTKLNRFVAAYMEMRSLIAIRSVAQNSIAHIVAEKASGSLDAESNAPFLKAMMVDMGIEPTVANDMIGDNPSYYAQMEFLTRQIYYHPDFIANLYDKPANVRRMTAAMTAIKSMQNWQIGEALKRREMLTSVLLEIKLREKQMELETVDIPTLIYGQPDFIGP